MTAPGQTQFPQATLRDSIVLLRRVALGEVIQKQVADMAATRQIKFFKISQRSKLCEADHCFGRNISITQIDEPDIWKTFQHAPNVTVVDAAACRYNQC